MNAYLLFLTILSSVALVLSIISWVVWWKDADYWIDLRADMKFLKEEYKRILEKEKNERA